MPAPTLVSSCTKACIKNVQSTFPSFPTNGSQTQLTSPGLFDVGDFEYFKIAPVLRQIKNPEQLHQIEVNSPQIKGEDAELWHSFIQRDIPNWKTKNYIPKNPTKWYEVYLKYKKEQRKELERDEAVLRASLAELNKKKATNVSKIVELRKLPKLPRDPRMMANNGGVPLGRNRETGVYKPAASALTWNSGSKTKLTDGKSVLTRARREAKEISQRGKLARPTAELHGSTRQIKRAPAGMVDEYRRDKLAAMPHAVKILSRKRSNAIDFDGGLGGPSLEEREKRLRALTMSRGNAAGAAEATLVGSSDEEEEGSDLDDLFDEKPKPQSRSVVITTSSRPQASSSSLSTIRSSLSSSAPRLQPIPPSTVRSSSSSSTVRAQPRSAPSSSPPVPRPKPSDMISSIISKPRPKPSPRAPSPPRPGTPTTFSRSPSPGGERRLVGMIKRRAPVDIFNRAPSKKPRAR
jgi:elongin-A